MDRVALLSVRIDATRTREITPRRWPRPQTSHVFEGQPELILEVAYELIVFFRHCLRAGLTQEQAGNLYIKRYKRLNSAKRVAEQYRQAEAWWKRREHWTDMEKVDLLNYCADITGLSRWNSDEQVTADERRELDHCILAAFKQTVPGFPA